MGKLARTKLYLQSVGYRALDAIHWSARIVTTPFGIFTTNLLSLFWRIRHFIVGRISIRLRS